MGKTNSVIDVLVDAITASGKKFNQIDKKSIFVFLENQNIDRNKFESIYQELTNIYNSSSKDKDSSTISVVDYNDSSHNDVKTRQPRKSVFSEIKKIAG